MGSCSIAKIAAAATSAPTRSSRTFFHSVNQLLRLGAPDSRQLLQATLFTSNAVVMGVADKEIRLNRQQGRLDVGVPRF